MRLVVVQCHVERVVTAAHAQALFVKVNCLPQQHWVLCLQPNLELVVALDLLWWLVVCGVALSMWT